MIILLVLVFIIILIELAVIGVTFSKMTVEVRKCDISYNEKILSKIYVENFEVALKIYVFKIIKIFTIKIYKDYIKFFFIKIKFSTLKKMKFARKAYFDFFKDSLIIFKNREEINFKLLKPKLDILKLKLVYGTISQFLTTFSVPTISTLLSVFLSNSIINYKKENYDYKIIPKYINRNFLNIKLNTKLTFSTINLIIFLANLKDILYRNKI